MTVQFCLCLLSFLTHFQASTKINCQKVQILDILVDLYIYLNKILKNVKESACSNFCCLFPLALKNTLANFPKQNITSYFRRVHVELNSLKVIATDTTFASQKYVSYGQPSICGTNNCIGGMSRVDLRGTHFQLKVSNIFLCSFVM